MAGLQQQCCGENVCKTFNCRYPPGHAVRQASRPQCVATISECDLLIMQDQLDVEMTEKERLEDLLHDERAEKQEYQQKLDSLQQDAEDQLAAQKGAYEQRVAQLQQELQAVRGHQVGHGPVVKAECC